MPQDPLLHARQKRKNLILLGILVGIAVLFFAMTVVKLAHKPSYSVPEPQANGESGVANPATAQ